MAVALLHLSDNAPGPWPGWINYGGQGVNVFFVLSGYILTMVYCDLRPADIAGFWRNRVARIFPLHVVVLTILVVGVLGLEHLAWRSRDPGFFDPASLPYHYTLTFVWFGMPLGWNSPAWSLSVELAAYILFPLWLFALRRLSRRWIAFIGAGLAAIAVAQNLTETYYTGALALLLGLSEFGAGSALRLARLPRSWSRTAEAIGARTLDYPPLVWLGRISYSIYLIHAPLLIVWLKLVPPMSPLPMTAAFFAVLVPISHLSFVLIERPGRSLLRSRPARPTAAGPSAPDPVYAGRG